MHSLKDHTQSAAVLTLHPQACSLVALLQGKVWHCWLTSDWDREKGMPMLSCLPPLFLFSLVFQLISAKVLLGNPKLCL